MVRAGSPMEGEFMIARFAVSPAAHAGVALAALGAVPAAAEDASVAQRLEREGIKYEVDSDGDYKVLYNYKKEGRTQVVFVAGKTETVSGLAVREIFSPAGRVSADGIVGSKALELLEGSSKIKLGSWEIRGDVLYLVVKVLDSATAQELASITNVTAGTADDMEIELSGAKDEL